MINSTTCTGDRLSVSIRMSASLYLSSRWFNNSWSADKGFVFCNKGRVLSELVLSTSVVTDAQRQTTFPLFLRDSIIPCGMQRPPPQATRQFSWGCPWLIKSFSKLRKCASPFWWKIWDTFFLTVFSISWSESRKFIPRFLANIFPSVVFPVPIKPTK